jgi:DNA invertase Pin-like site-specific DNA recombinase
MSVVGYCRVSSAGQSLEVQLDKLKEHGCDEIFKEKKSGTTANREELQACLKYVRKGDSLVVTKLDRLARSTLHLTQIAQLLKGKEVDLVVLDQQIDTSSPTGRLMFNMLACIAEFETEIRKERQLEGIAKAKERGVHFGRKATLRPLQVQEMRQKRASGVKIKDLMAEYRLSKASVYRLLKADIA